MASGRVFVCSRCTHSITTWDEGDPYYLDAAGTKQYAYHPDPARDQCVGIDEAMLCLSCGAESAQDSRAPTNQCPQCLHSTLVSTYELEGVRCPVCAEGVFRTDPTTQIIS